MCKGVCFVISRTGEIYNSEENISCHEEIIDEHNIRDGNMRNIVRIEMLPQGDLFSTEREDWKFSVDESDPPNWFTENKQEFEDKCYNRLWSIIFDWKKNNKISGSLDLEDTQIKSLGKLESVGGYLNLIDTPIETLGDLESVDGWLTINTNIRSLGKLKHVGGSLDLRGEKIKTLGKLRSVGYLQLDNTKIKSLGKLEYVDTDLYIRNTPIKSLGKLKSIGFDLHMNKSQLNIEDGIVKGNIYEY
jgi:hypothetical protein